MATDRTNATPARQDESAPEPSPTRIRATVAGEARTELESVVSAIPWGDAFTFGAGVDAITGGVAGTAVKPFTPKEPGPTSSWEHYSFIQSDSELNREVEASASGKYNIGSVALSASTSYLSKIQYSELTVTLLAKFQSQFERYDEADHYELTEEAKGLMADPAKFRKAYGDYFVAGGRRSSRFTAVYTCKTTTAKSMEEFKASFGGAAPNVFSAEGSARFLQAASEHNVRVTADLVMEGHKPGSVPNGPWTPEKIMEALAWFKDNLDGVNLQAKLKHYSTIDPNYSRTVEVAPDVFVELRQLYTTVWDIRSGYASLPRYYQDQFKKAYTAVDSGVTANQNILATDADKRLDYQQKADELMSDINDVYARMDFYFKVVSQVGKEPGKDKRIDEGTGQQTWIYGFSTYTKSGAVVINSNSMRYRESWHVGHRENTFEFGPKGDHLIVGWEVISNWNDGTNGGWWKAVDQILLKDYLAVHVTSLYDRGCDWSLIVYYVDAKDYQFES
ncbi:MAG TPA: hypothetical protein VN256_20000 [Pyrinomonadaceae bacterium]|nr:hypothetical protein [Pyrinomonadaceae bacterium]